MGLISMIGDALAWSPYLAGGFAHNLLIAVVSMGLGTALGGGLGWARAQGAILRLPADLLTNLCRNVPSFVLLFYVAFALPVEIEWAGQIIGVPLWIKASLALTIPVIGFASDQSLALGRQIAQGLTTARATFLTSWLQYFLIIVMASATASVIGADEIVGRANRVIAADHRPQFLVVVYVYVSLWFLVAGLGFSALTRALARFWHARRPGPASDPAGAAP